jgi:hypothetical protein
MLALGPLQRSTRLSSLPSAAIGRTDITVPAPCPMRRSTEGRHGHSRTTLQTPQPGLAHVDKGWEET